MSKIGEGLKTRKNFSKFDLVKLSYISRNKRRNRKILLDPALNSYEWRNFRILSID